MTIFVCADAISSFLMPCSYYPSKADAQGHDSPKTLLMLKFALPFRIEVGIDEQYYVDSSLNLVVHQCI